MENNYIGYLLDALDDDERTELETARAESPRIQSALDMLQKAIDPLAADKEEFEPPADLATRTIGFVAEYVVQNERSVFSAPPADLASPAIRAIAPPKPAQPPVYPVRTSEAEPPRYRKRNLAVSIGLSGAVLLVLVASVFTVRQTREVQACQNNMRAVHQGLQTYCDLNESKFPQVLSDENVGTAVARMQQSGTMPPNTAFLCPGAEGKRSPQDNIDYAYHLGYRDGRGELRGLERTVDSFPILADAPLRKGLETTPINHRKGQNVLFTDGKVEFRTSPFVGPIVGDRADDIFLNTDKQPRAGTHRLDCVLGREKEKP